MEDLPNKMRDLLGSVADVDLVREGVKQFVRITVEPYPYPIRYKGEYHERSGSTKQVLKRAALPTGSSCASRVATGMACRRPISYRRIAAAGIIGDNMIVTIAFAEESIHETGKKKAWDRYTLGVLKGIYDFDKKSRTEFKSQTSPDNPMEGFGILLEKWKELRPEKDACDWMQQMLEESCPACRVDVSG